MKHIKIIVHQTFIKDDNLNILAPDSMNFSYEDSDTYESFSSSSKKDLEWRSAVKLFKYLGIETKKPKDPLVNELLIIDILCENGYEFLSVLRNSDELIEGKLKRENTDIYFRI